MFHLQVTVPTASESMFECEKLSFYKNNLYLFNNLRIYLCTISNNIHSIELLNQVSMLDSKDFFRYFEFNCLL